MIECCLSIAPADARKIMQAPCPPMIAIKKSRKVDTLEPRLDPESIQLQHG